MPRLRMTKARIESYITKRHRFVIEFQPLARDSQGKTCRLWELRVLTSQFRTRPGLWRTSVVFQSELLQEVVDKAVELLKPDMHLCYFHRQALRLTDGSYKRFNCLPDLIAWAKEQKIENPIPESDTSISLPEYLDHPWLFEKQDAEEGPRARPQPGPNPYDE